MTTPADTRGFDDALAPAVYSGLWRYCCRLAPTREDAEDLLQDTLCLALRAWGALKDRERVRPWLLTIARRNWLMRLRTATRRPQAVPDYAGQPAVEADDPFTRDVLEALGSLAPQESELLLLYYIEGLELAEVAEVTGRSYSAVRQGLLRARRSLRSTVEGIDAEHRAVSQPTGRR